MFMALVFTILLPKMSIYLILTVNSIFFNTLEKDFKTGPDLVNMFIFLFENSLQFMSEILYGLILLSNAVADFY